MAQVVKPKVELAASKKEKRSRWSGWTDGQGCAFTPTSSASMVHWWWARQILQSQSHQMRWFFWASIRKIAREHTSTHGLCWRRGLQTRHWDLEADVTCLVCTQMYSNKMNHMNSYEHCLPFISLKHVKALWSSLSWTPLCFRQLATVRHSSTQFHTGRVLFGLPPHSWPGRLAKKI